MHFQFDVAPTARAKTVTPDETQASSETAELLRQLLDIQREQLQLLRTTASAHDSNHRWRSFLSRWQEDFGALPSACKKVLPQLERAYITLIADLAAHLNEEALDNDFTLGEFLDRYGIRLGQLGSILHLVGPLAEIDSASEEKST